MNTFKVILVLLWLSSCDAQTRKKSLSFSPASKIRFGKNSNISLKTLLERHPEKNRRIKLFVSKSDYYLYILKDDSVIKSYPIVLGFKPIGNKEMEGDGKTPEGLFKIRTKYPHNKWNKFIWIDYPNEISYTQFEEKKKKGLIPKNAKIGGSVGIHGVPLGKDYAIDEKQNWTLGCISLKNADIDDLYPYVDNETSVEIKK